MQYLEIPCINKPPLRIKIKDLLFKGISKYQKIEIYDTEEFGRCLFIDGIIQCSEKDHFIYDKAILKKMRDTDKNILILGGGDGYLAEMAINLHPDVKITIVDLDEMVVNSCKNYLGQHVFENVNVKLFIDDALIFMKERQDAKYDGIICDLTEFPIGYSNNKIVSFYEDVFKLSYLILNNNGWIGVYAGIKDMTIDENKALIDILTELLTKNFRNLEKAEVFIPSFGESCLFLYAYK
jgi:spermidine synthase